jgi:GT2 family glycosyltransferase
MSLVPIVIPFFREHDKLKKCLAAIQAQTHTACEPFVRDNTHDNILFTAAVNEGLEKYAYRPDVRYVMVLNQDAYLKQDCVRQLVEFMDAHPQCGIACPLQIAEGNPAMSWAGQGKPLVVTPARHVTWGGSLQAFPVGVHRNDDFASYVQPVETPWANGACMMIRTQTIREIGLMDRNMRFICSDADFSFAARARGWQVFLVPKALAEHSLGASGEKSANPELDRVKLKDALYFAEKWLDGGLFRNLSLEGPELTRIGVRGEIRKLREALSDLEQRMGAAQPASGMRLPEWSGRMDSSPRQGPFRQQA